MNKFLLSFILALSFLHLQAGSPVWSTDIAPILYKNCVKCHNPGGIGKFSLMTYSDAFAYSSSIKSAAVTKGIMPPWPPNPKYTHYKDERVLSGVEKKAIMDWVDAGAPSGDLSKAPPAPVINNGSKLSSIDLSLTMPTYTSQATSNDLYRCFVLDPSLTSNKKIEEIEVIPGNINIVHHVLIYQDTTGTPDILDAADPGPGYTSFGGIGSNAANLIGAWVPGSSPKKLPYGIASTLFKNSKIVIQIHYPRGTNGAKDSTKINIRYSTHSNPREAYFNSILNEGNIKNYTGLVIPKDSIRTFRQEFKIPNQDYTFLSIAPHMHLVGVSYKVFAVTLNGDTIRGIDIPKWDFHWQDEYVYKKLQRIPKGSTLYGYATYDNTLNNPNNPNNPTKTVVHGEATSDEMMLTFISYMPYQTGDENIVLDTSADIDTDMPKNSAITTNDNSNMLRIYFNPSSNQLELQIQTEISGLSQFEIMDMNGKRMNRAAIRKELEAGINKFYVPLDYLPAGRYLIKGNSAKESYVKGFIK